MNALTSVVALLALLGIATYARVQQAVDRDLLLTSLHSQLEARRALSNDWERGIYQLQIQKPQTGEEGTHSRGDGKGTRHRIRRVESRLNLVPALLGNANDRKLFAKLAQRLVPHPALPEIMEILERKLDPTYVTKPGEFCGTPTSLEQLASFDLQDQKLQAVWPKILDELSEFVSWQTDTKRGSPKINVIYAPLPLLEAIFGARPEVEQFYEWREKEIDHYNASVRDSDGPTRQKLRNQIREKLGSLAAGSDLGGRNLVIYFDYSLMHNPGALTLHGQDQRGQIQLRTLRQT